MMTVLLYSAELHVSGLLTLCQSYLLLGMLCVEKYLLKHEHDFINPLHSAAGLKKTLIVLENRQTTLAQLFMIFN